MLLYGEPQYIVSDLRVGTGSQFGREVISQKQRNALFAALEPVRPDGYLRHQQRQDARMPAQHAIKALGPGCTGLLPGMSAAAPPLY